MRSVYYLLYCMSGYVGGLNKSEDKLCIKENSKAGRSVSYSIFPSKMLL